MVVVAFRGGWGMGCGRGLCEVNNIGMVGRKDEVVLVVLNQQLNLLPRERKFCYMGLCEPYE